MLSEIEFNTLSLTMLRCEGERASDRHSLYTHIHKDLFMAVISIACSEAGEQRHRQSLLGDWLNVNS